MWDRWNLFLWQFPLLGQLWVEVPCCFWCYLVMAAVGLCSGRPEGMQRPSAALGLGSGIRKEGSSDRSGRQMQGHNLSQKQFKKCGVGWQRVPWASHQALPSPPYISEGSVSAKPSLLFKHSDKDLGQFMFHVVGFEALGPGLEEGNEAGPEHGGWFSRGFFCRHHVRLARASNRHGATATKHIPTASWTSTRHPKVKSYLHA